MAEFVNAKINLGRDPAYLGGTARMAVSRSRSDKMIHHQLANRHFKLPSRNMEIGR
jgi:hypothetical protein